MAMCKQPDLKHSGATRQIFGAFGNCIYANTMLNSKRAAVLVDLLDAPKQTDVTHAEY
jgi:hypothetical protein